MREGITKVDLNFTNAGGGHTASVTSLLNPKSVETGEDLGIVVGELGETNNFSNPKITEMLGNFICTQKTTSAGPTKKAITRRYVDRTSLLLESYIVLVRGVNSGPDGGKNFEGPVPYFTEVTNTPLKPFRSQGPRVEGSIIYLGKVYNVESAANFQGVKISLVYHNRQLKENLSLNTEFVNGTYKAAPDLSQYDLKFGYTLSDFRSALNSVGLAVNGLPSDDRILFETSGTLGSVVSSIAGTLGYFWYVDPKSGSINFINSEVASQIPIDNYTDTTNSNIVSASFTESTIFNKIVNVYNGSTEKDSNNPKDDDRPRPIFFKRCRFETLGIHKKASRTVLAAFFSLFDQEESDDVFDKFTYFATAIAKNKALKNEVFGKEKLNDHPFDLSKLYDYEPVLNPERSALPLIPFLEEHGGNQDEKLRAIFNTNDADAKREAKRTSLLNMDRIANKFKYIRLTQYTTEGGKNVIKKMPRPHGSELYSFLKLFYQIAGGIYISNGYSEYKVERMEFSNSNNVNVVGPLKASDRIDEISELSPITDFFDSLGLKQGVTVKELANLTQAENRIGGVPAKSTHEHHFIAIRSIPKLERVKSTNNQKIVQKDAKVDFSPLQEYYEIYENPNRKEDLLIGGPTSPNNLIDSTLVEGMKHLMNQSIDNYYRAIKKKTTLRLTYKRSKTRVNKTNEDGEEAEDDELAEASEDDQKIAELFDRYDLKYNSIESPSHNMLNKLTLSSASGSTAEMKVLQQIRGKYRNRFDKPQSSSRTFYGLEIPDFSPTMNSVSISIGPQGITTTVSESTIKLIPPDQNLQITEGMEALTPKSMLPRSFNARQRNTLGL